MLPPDLKKYLEDCKNKSLDFDSFEPLLVKAGWSDDTIAVARAWYQLPTFVPPDPDPSQ